MTPARIATYPVADADELAAILAALAALDRPMRDASASQPSRWRFAARDYETGDA